MAETYMISSGSIEAYENGQQVEDVHYNAQSDGNNIDFYVKDNEDEYYGYGPLDDTTLLQSLNAPATSMPLIEQLEKDFPLKLTKSKKGSKKQRRSKKAVSKRGTKKK
jgi:hypothetical protein